ncbi:MAG: hypothetical protein WAV18_28010, partial [Roseiarcus sp.]
MASWRTSFPAVRHDVDRVGDHWKAVWGACGHRANGMVRMRRFATRAISVMARERVTAQHYYG